MVGRVGMVDKKTGNLFFNKNVILERIVIVKENGIVAEKIWVSKGHVERVTDTDLVLKFNGTLQALALDSIRSIREVAT